MKRLVVFSLILFVVVALLFSVCTALAWRPNHCPPRNPHCKPTNTPRPSATPPATATVRTPVRPQPRPAGTLPTGCIAAFVLPDSQGTPAVYCQVR